MYQDFRRRQYCYSIHSLTGELHSCLMCVVENDMKKTLVALGSTLASTRLAHCVSNPASVLRGEEEEGENQK